MKESIPSVLRQKSLYFDCHSGLDPESSICELDSRFRWNDGFGINVKKRWTHYTSMGLASGSRQGRDQYPIRAILQSAEVLAFWSVFYAAGR